VGHRRAIGNPDERVRGAARVEKAAGLGFDTSELLFVNQQ
jgi:hypothetical protein